MLLRDVPCLCRGGVVRRSCPSRRDDEEDLLFSTLDKKPNSRLSCQILLNDELDGLELTIAPSARGESQAA